jgi:hypothetical protein
MMFSSYLTTEETVAGFGLYLVSVWPGMGNLSMRRESVVVLKELGPSNAIFKLETPGGGFQYLRQIYGTLILDDGEENEDEEAEWHIASRPFPSMRMAISFALLGIDSPQRVRIHPYLFKRADAGRTVVHRDEPIRNIQRVSFDFGPPAKVEMYPSDGRGAPNEVSLTLHFTDGSEKTFHGPEAVSLQVSLQWDEIVELIRAQLSNRTAFRIDARDLVGRFKLPSGYWISIIQHLENAYEQPFEFKTLGKDTFGDPIGLITFTCPSSKML